MKKPEPKKPATKTVKTKAPVKKGKPTAKDEALNTVVTPNPISVIAALDSVDERLEKLQKFAFDEMEQAQGRLIALRAELKEIENKVLRRVKNEIDERVNVPLMDAVTIHQKLVDSCCKLEKLQFELHDKLMGTTTQSLDAWKTAQAGSGPKDPQKLDTQTKAEQRAAVRFLNALVQHSMNKAQGGGLDDE